MAARHQQPTWGQWRGLQTSHPSHLFLPLAPSLTEINPQESSPLFNGCLPAEIRNQIFEYALTETMSTGVWSPPTVFTPPPSVAVRRYSGMMLKQTYPTLQAPVSLHFPYPRSTYNGVYPVNTPYTRPGYKGAKRVYVGLLRTCKRIYLETHHLPFVAKEHIFWHEAGPPNLKFSDERSYFQRFRADQLAFVNQWHVFAHQSWLENNFQHVCRFKVLEGIEKLTITLRHGDWWDNETNALLRIDPHARESDYVEMLLNREKYDEGRAIEWDPHSWGSAFREMKSLKELEMELECPDYKTPELEAIVLHAQKWRFPMRGGLVLSAEELPVKTEYWRAPKSRWTRQCPNCDGTDNQCKLCAEKAELIAERKGPRMVVMTVRWRLARNDSDSWYLVSAAL